MKSEKTTMGRGPAPSERSESRGFTLIELLIVIALIGILAVALLSAINPLEQLRKGRDTTRKADASEILNAIERFYTSYQCYPWAYSNSTCGAVAQRDTAPGNPDFSINGAEEGLITTAELKPEFQTRLETSGNPSYQKLFIFENMTEGVQTAGSVNVCYEPESTTGRGGGLGRTQGDITDSTVSANCGGDYSGGTSANGTACWICVPQ